MLMLRAWMVLCAVTITAVLVRDAEAHTAFVRLYDDWRVEASGTDLGTTWRSASFDDSAWLLGETPIGGGSGPNFTTEITTGQQTTYLRHAFDLDVDPASVTSITFSVAYSHGFVAYLNGQEVVRRNLPGGPITFNTAATLHPVDPVSPFETFDVSAPLGLVAGANVLAVELHQTSPTDPLLLWAPIVTFQTSEEHVTRGPYLQMATPEAITLRWRTSVATDSEVRFGLAPEALDQVESDPNVTTEHELRLAGLLPATRFYYSVGSTSGPIQGGDEDHAFTTPAAAGSEAPARIWVLGDAGAQDHRQRSVRDGYATFTGTKPTDAWLMLGDNAYGAGTDQEYQFAVFEGMYEATLRTSQLWPTIGNHDWQSGVAVPYLDIFSLPTQAEAGGIASQSERFYAFDYANVHFVTVDTGLFDSAISTEADRTEMLDWLAADLQATNQPWLIAFFHHPPYSKGSHDSDFDGLLSETRTFLVPMLEANGVDLVLTGHSHDYERSFLIDGNTGTSFDFSENPELYTVDPGDGRQDGSGAYEKPAQRGPHQGTVYIVNGNSGGRGDGNEFPLDHPAMVELHDPHNDRTANGVMAPGSLVLDLDGKRLDVSYVDFEGEVLDHFTISKGSLTGGSGGGDAGGQSAQGGATSGAGGGGEGGAAGGAGSDDVGSEACSCRVVAPTQPVPYPCVGLLLALALRRWRSARSSGYPRHALYD